VGGTDTIVVSVLTFILLVVLGGGLGLLAVSLAESPKPATDRGDGTRAPDVETELDPPLDEAVDDVREDPMTAGLEPDPVEPEASLDDELAAVLATAAPDPPARTAQRAPDPRRVPLAYTAIEGRYDVVAVSPLWRRLLSLVALTAIALAIGAALAAVAAAVFGALAELLNSAVG